MTTLQQKIDYAVVFRVTNANPNGDPLNGNRPRITYDGFGELTDVCLKRKMRNRLMEAGKPIFVQSDDNKVDMHPNLKSRASEVLSEKTVEAIINKACKTWFDVRAFGQLFPFKGANEKKGKGKEKESEEAGDDKGVSIGIRGPVSVQSAFSVTPVSDCITSNQITKSTSNEGDGIKRQPDQMGMKHRIDRGIYVVFGSMNPQLAEKTGFSDADAQAIKQVLPKLFENDASSARPEGSMEVLKVIWWQHNNKAGQYSSAKVHRTLTVSPDGSISLGSLNGLTPEIIDGF